MRKQIIALCQELKLPIIEKRFKIAELKKAEAIFLTNVIRGIVPVDLFENKEFSSSTHPLVNFLQTCLQQLVEGNLSQKS